MLFRSCRNTWGNKVRVQQRWPRVENSFRFPDPPPTPPEHIELSTTFQSTSAIAASTANTAQNMALHTVQNTAPDMAQNTAPCMVRIKAQLSMAFPKEPTTVEMIDKILEEMAGPDSDDSDDPDTPSPMFSGMNADIVDVGAEVVVDSEVPKVEDLSTTDPTDMAALATDIIKPEETMFTEQTEFLSATMEPEPKVEVADIAIPGDIVPKEEM